MAPSGSSFLIFDVHYDGRFNFMPLRPRRKNCIKDAGNMSVEELVNWAKEEADMASKAFDDDISVTSVVKKDKRLADKGKGLADKGKGIMVDEWNDDNSNSDIDTEQRFKGSADLEEMYKGNIDSEREYSNKYVYYLSEGKDELISLRKRNIEAKKILIQVGEKSSKDQVIARCGLRHEKLKDTEKGKQRKCNKYPSVVSPNQCRNAKKFALNEGETITKEHYAMIRSYGKAILDLIHGFQLGCMPVIGSDGNNHIYPIAWAIVNVENKDIWSWFLQLFGEEIDMPTENGLTLISDQHRVWLIEAVKDVMPLAEHR
nr:hypothetical protein [Tanacetum cinerariifolium]